ncbi:MAG: penicillin-insensitive murein endopeptidase [Deltaproteobacteria bacterium]|nr:penicillin-insensitive murein endopeptidase [Deltaproteobacteria bacterium]
MLRFACAAALALAVAGCAELGASAMGDGTSVSVGRPSNGYIRNAKKLPDSGDGFRTQAVWKERNNRYGTDELLDLITGVGRRMSMRFTDVKLVVADLSGNGGGESRKWHRSHQSGRDVDLVYYMRAPDGASFEADAMRVFGIDGKAKDGSGYSVDVPRTWQLVKNLVTAPEARVQWVFMYEPIAQMLLAHAVATGEAEALIARARKAMKQPGDSAPHNDHMHVRIYCSDRDRMFGCADIGPMELYAEYQAEAEQVGKLPPVIASLFEGAAQIGSSTMLGIASSGEPDRAAPPEAVRRLIIAAPLRFWRR